MPSRLCPAAWFLILEGPSWGKLLSRESLDIVGIQIRVGRAKEVYGEWASSADPDERGRRAGASPSRRALVGT